MSDASPFLLDRFAVKPHHVEAFLPLWERDVALRAEHGVITHRAFLETDAEPKMTWLYEHPEGLGVLPELAADPRMQQIEQEMAPHVFRNRVVREVRPEVVTHATAESIVGSRGERIAIMRRYSIVGGWEGFLDVWHRIVPVREKYGFRCLFAVADEPHDLFTWAFDFDGDFADFGPAQRDYYHDPDRVELRKVFDHMADYSIHPARQLLWHPTEGPR